MVDYSKWKKVEISDDEDDTHPNIDTPSLFRWRHKARQEREEKHQSDVAELERRRKAAAVMPRNTAEEIKAADDELADIEKEQEKLEKRSRLRPYNVDSIGTETWDSTIVNKKKEDNDKGHDDVLDEEHFEDFQMFVEANEAKLKEFSFLNGVNACKRFFMANPSLASKYTLNWITLRCVDLKFEGNLALLKHVARQAVILEMILDIAKHIGRGCDPRNCLPVFFERYRDNASAIEIVIEDLLEQFLQRVSEGAQLRLQLAAEKMEKEKKESQGEQVEEEKLLGPGGLDPQEVFQELNPELQEAFVERDIQKFRDALYKMEVDEAQKTMERCIDSGLWMAEKTGSNEEEEFLNFQAQQEQRNMIYEKDIEKEPVNDEDDENVELTNVFSKLIINPYTKEDEVNEDEKKSVEEIEKFEPSLDDAEEHESESSEPISVDDSAN